MITVKENIIDINYIVLYIYGKYISVKNVLLGTTDHMNIGIFRSYDELTSLFDFNDYVKWFKHWHMNSDHDSDNLRYEEVIVISIYVLNICGPSI